MTEPTKPRRIRGKENRLSTRTPIELKRNAQGHLICGASDQRYKNNECPRMAGKGTDHEGSGRCAWHYGDAPTQKKRAAKEAVVALASKTGLGSPIDIDPAEAVLQEVRRAAGNVAFYQDIIDSWSYPEGQVGVLLVQLNGDMFEKSTIIKMYNEERDRLVLYAKTAIAAGIAKREIELAEQQAMILNQVVSAILTDLGHDLADQQLRRVVTQRMLEGRRLRPVAIEA